MLHNADLIKLKPTVVMLRLMIWVSYHKPHHYNSRLSKVTAHLCPAWVVRLCVCNVGVLWCIINGSTWFLVTNEYSYFALDDPAKERELCPWSEPDWHSLHPKSKLLLHHTGVTRWCNGKAFGLAISRSRVRILLEAMLRNNLRQVVYTYVPLSPSSITWYRPKGGDALRPGW